MSETSLPVIVDGLGVRRPLGRTPLPPGFKLAVRGAARVIPESQWQEFDVRQVPGYPLKVKDQNGFGACVGHAAASSLELARWYGGLDHVDLSPWYVYAILCQGWDRGASIGEALGVVREKGAPAFSAVPYGTINPRKLSDASHADAGRHRVEIGAVIETWDEFVSAVALRQSINFSVHAGSNFDRLDDEGVAGFSSGPGNHAVSAGFGLKRLRNGEWAPLCLNSWTVLYGDGGYFHITRKHWEQQSYREAYVVQAVADDPTDPIPTPGV